jgi:hypothetical protein
MMFLSVDLTNFAYGALLTGFAPITKTGQNNPAQLLRFTA